MELKESAFYVYLYKNKGGWQMERSATPPIHKDLEKLSITVGFHLPYAYQRSRTVHMKHDVGNGVFLGR